MVVDETNPRLALRRYRRNGELERLVVVLRGEPGVSALIALFLVNPRRFFFLQNLSLDLELAQVDGHLREAGALGQGERIDGLEIHAVRIVESLNHLRLSESVVDGNVDVMVQDLDGGVIGAARGQVAGPLESALPPNRVTIPRIQIPSFPFNIAAPPNRF